MKNSLILLPAVFSAGLLGACSAMDPSLATDASEGETLQHGEAVTVAPPISSYVVLARQEVNFNSRSVVRGANVAVRPGGGAVSEVNAGANSQIGIGFDTMAQRLTLGDDAVAGFVDAMQIILGEGAETGATSPYLAPAPLPAPTPATVGTVDVVVNSGQTQSLVQGRYDEITVNGTLNLSGGLYEVRSLTVNNDARVNAQARSAVRVLNGVVALDRSRIAPVAGLNASDLTIEASGRITPNSPLGVSFGNDVQLGALLIASQGIVAGDRFVANGAIAGRTVSAGYDASVSFQGGFGCSRDTDCSDGGSCAGSCIDAQCQMPAECTALQVSPGNDHACAVMADGHAECWGDNAVGDTGRGEDTPKVPPAPVLTNELGVLLSSVRSIDAGGSQSCAVLSDGKVWCWGLTLTQGGTFFAKPVTGISGATSVSVGSNQVCARLSSGDVSCLSGANPTPTLVGLTNATSVSTIGSFACAVLSTGRVRCWGDNNAGQLGTGAAGQAQPAPGVLVPGVTTAVAVTTSDNFACAVLANGTAKCWGKNGAGNIGNGVPADDAIYGPTTVTGLSDAVGIAAGANHVCAVRRTGAVQCWGRNFDGQLGTGNTTEQYAPGAQVNRINSAKGVGAATNFSCGLLRDGRAYCWGKNSSANLGNGSGELPPEYSPVQVLF